VFSFAKLGVLAVTWLHQARDLLTVRTSLTRVATTAAPDSIAAPTMGVIIEIGMEVQLIGMTVPGMPTVHEAVPRIGMTGPEVQPDGAGARRRGIMARVTLVDIAEARRAGAAVRKVRPDGAAARRRGAGDPARFTGLVVAPDRGGVRADACLG
jgi:hypothetical protein